MSVSYTLNIRRKADGRLIAKTDLNAIRAVMDVDRDILPTRGEAFGLSSIHSAIDRARMEADGHLAEERRLKEGMFKCKSVEVRRDIEEDVRYHHEMWEAWRNACDALHEIVGMVRCLSESMMFGPWMNADSKEGLSSPKGDGDGDDVEFDESDRLMAYSRFAVRHDGEKDEKGNTVRPEYCWADDCLLSVTCD